MLRSWFDKKFGRPRKVAVFSVPNDQGEGRKEGRKNYIVETCSLIVQRTNKESIFNETI